MLLCELFDTPNTQIVEITPDDAAEYGFTHLSAAYEFKVGDQLFVAYFEHALRQEGFSFGYARIVREKSPMRVSYSHSLTDARTPLPVLASVMKILLSFISEHQPETVSFSGFENRQTDFYRSFAKAISKRLPEGYYVVQDRERRRFYVSRSTILQQEPHIIPLDG